MKWGTILNTDNKNGADFQYDDLYDETIGFFSDPFYKKQEVKKEYEDSIINETESVNGIKKPNVEVAYEIPINFDIEIVNKPIEEEKRIVVESEVEKQTDVLEEFDEGTCNAFAYISPNVDKQIEQPSKKQDEEKNNKGQFVKINNNSNMETIETSKTDIKKNDTQKTVNGISYAFFEEEKSRILKTNKKEKKKYQILCIVCVALFFTVIPLLLLPGFVLKYIKIKKMSAFNVSVNYNTLKWNSLKNVDNYEVYSRIENTDKFKLVSIEQQSKSILPRGKNGYIVVAKKANSMVAISELIDVSV